MRLVHRRAHVGLWLVLGPLLLIGLIAGIQARSEMPSQEPPVVQEAASSRPPAVKASGQ